ncbi:MAG TPA: metal-sensing transcriptional repressor [Atribacteraceae bacterium]|nr:metal-sensing transcriptional repressor [Atribacteraceae bacterium]
MNNPGPKHAKNLRMLQNARGQLDAVIRMINEDAYCIDISRQILAAISMLRKANSKVLHRHLETCLRTALETGNAAEKINELEAILAFMEKNL